MKRIILASLMVILIGLYGCGSSVSPTIAPDVSIDEPIVIAPIVQDVPEPAAIVPNVPPSSFAPIYSIQELAATSVAILNVVPPSPVPPPKPIIEPMWDKAIEVFDVSLHAELQKVGMTHSPDVKTAITYYGVIIVNPYWEEFSDAHRLNILIHEFLHCVQDKVDLDKFHQEVGTWFNDLSSGLPRNNDNYAKYYLDYQLYNNPTQGWYEPWEYAREEWAYLGYLITAGELRSKGIPDNIKAYYKGILIGV